MPVTWQSIAVAIICVVLGVILRPLFESWYARRNKSLVLEWDGPLQVVGFGGDGLQITINGNITRLVYIRNFVIRNRTRSTLREFNIAAVYDPPEDSGKHGDHVFMQTYVSNDIEVTAKPKAEAKRFNFVVERFDRGGKWKGQVAATYRADLRISTDAGYEVYQTDPSKPWHPRQLMFSIGPFVTWFAIVELVRFFKHV